MAEREDAPQENDLSREKKDLRLEHGILDAVLETFPRLTDAPQNFVIGAAFTILSAVYGPHVRLVVNVGRGYRRPKVWSLLVGSSGLDRKTTVQRLTLGVLRPVLPEECFLPSDFSEEGLVSLLASGEYRDKPAILHRDELGGLLKASREKSYLAGILSFMNRLYDEAPVKRVLRSGTFIIPEGTFVVFFGGLPTPLRDYVDLSDFKTGFMNRLLVAYKAGKTNWKPPLPTFDNAATISELTTKNSKLIRKLTELIAERLRHVKELRNQLGEPIPVIADNEVVSLFNDLAYRIEEDAQRRLELDPNDIVGIYESRLTELLASMLALIAVDKPVLESREVFLITVEHFKVFSELARLVLNRTFEALEDEFTSVYASLKRKIILAIRNVNQQGRLASLTEIHEALGGRVPAKQIRSILADLLDLGRVKIFARKRSRGFYVWLADLGEPPVDGEFKEVTAL